MKANFFSYLVYVLFLMLIITGRSPGMVSAADENFADGGNSDIGDLDTGSLDAENSNTGSSGTGDSDNGNPDDGVPGDDISGDDVPDDDAPGDDVPDDEVPGDDVPDDEVPGDDVPDDDVPDDDVPGDDVPDDDIPGDDVPGDDVPDDDIPDDDIPGNDVPDDDVPDDDVPDDDVPDDDVPSDDVPGDDVPDDVDSDNGKTDNGNTDNSKSDTSKSDTSKSDTSKPDISKSDTSKPDISKSDTSKPDASNSDTGNSYTENSGTGNSDTGGSEKNESSNSSSSSSGMDLVSSEPASNIYSKELVTRSIMGGYPVRFDFVENVTCITHVEFDSMKTFRKTTTVAEVLKNKSVFVPEPPTGRIYEYVNIWIGDKGAGLPTSLKNGFVGFKVEKARINDSNVNESLITLQWYNQGWHPLYTEKVGEDTNYIYFRSEVSAFSCFAITEYAGQKESKKEISIAEQLQEALISLGNKGDPITIGSAKKGNSRIENPMGLAKILMAISLPLFIGIAGYCILKKKI
jgi:PGF-pre-PGF domain-containing protein